MHMTKDDKLSLIKSIVIFGFTFAVIYYYWAAFYQGHFNYPYSTFVFNPGDKFNDFTSVHNWTRSLMPYQHGASYLPFAYVVMAPFALIKGWPALLFYFMTVTYFMIQFLYKNIPTVSKMDRIQGAFVLSFMTYPFLFTLDRGNIEALVFLFQAAFIVFYKMTRLRLAVLFLAAAIAMKGYSIVFLIIFMADKKVKESLQVLGIAACMTLFGAMVFGEGVVNNLFLLAQNVEASRHYFRAADYGMLHSSSLMSLLKFVLNPFIAGVIPAKIEVLDALHPYYLILAFGLLGVLSWFAFHERVFWKQVALLTIAEILLPEVSFDYKLLHLLVPMTLFVQADQPSRYDRFYCILFGLLLIPKTYWVVYWEVTSTSFLSPLLLLVLAIVLAKDFSSSRVVGMKRLNAN